MLFTVTTLPVKMRLERSTERDKRELVGASPSILLTQDRSVA